MYETDAFSKREKALEDEFFHRVDEKLRDELRQSMERDQKRKALAGATGFDDPTLLDELIDAELDPTTLVALSVVPSVFVAWADGHVTDAEQKAVIEAAHEQGIDENGVGGQLLMKWLEKRPPRSLWETWKHYASALKKSVSPATCATLHNSLRQQATAVAQASGGVLGIGKTSAAERRYLDEVDTVLGNKD